MENIAGEINAFILENFLFGDEARQINHGDSFLETGVVDSTGILELVGFVEERYGIEVDDEDLLPENFDSISSLSAYIARKMG